MLTKATLSLVLLLSLLLNYFQWSKSLDVEHNHLFVYSVSSQYIKKLHEEINFITSERDTAKLKFFQCLKKFGGK